MNLNELLTMLKMMGVDENSLRFAENCFELGRDFGFDEAKQRIKEKIDEMKGNS